MIILFLGIPLWTSLSMRASTLRHISSMLSLSSGTNAEICFLSNQTVVHYVIRAIGHMGIMYLGLMGYALRFAGYAVITNPWMAVPFEVLQGKGEGKQ